ncbi:MAG: group III truncated hemoglobin [Bacteroidota bacterium]
MQDLSNREDIELLVNTFYDIVKKDEVIGHIFNDIIGDNWSQHLPIMYQFWDGIIFSKPGYNGNPIKKHIDIDKKIALQAEHFQRWVLLWNTTVDNMFKGTNADEIKNRASLMIHLLDLKVKMARSGNLIQ